MTAIQKNYIPGSLAAVSADTGKPLAETFISADVVVLIDTSSSMKEYDGKEASRYERACAELRNLQGSLPGKIAVISFADFAQFHPTGVPARPCGMTDLTQALKFAKMADVSDMRFVVISDGEPNDQYSALLVASEYQNRIDTIYIGREGGSGQRFLERLARESGGKFAKTAGARQLEQTVKGLLNG